MKKTMKKVILAVLIPITALVFVYIGISVYYQNIFYNGTWINGVDFSNQSVETVMETLANQSVKYTLKLQLRDGGEEEIQGSDIGYQLVYDEVKDLKKQQGMWMWVLGLIDVQFYTVEENIAYDQEKLARVIDNLDCMTNAAEPEDAYVDTSEGIKLVEEKQGSKIIREDLMELVTDAIENGQNKIDLAEANCYAQPAVTTESKEIQEIMAPIQAITGVQITYDFGDEQEILGQDKISEWVYLDENNQVAIDEAKVREYVVYLRDKYDTRQKPRQFVTSYGNTVTVPVGSKNGIYGWEIFEDKEVEAILNNLTQGISETREPVYYTRGLHRGADDIGGTYIEISISNQKMWLYKDYQLIVETNIVTGTVSGGRYDTPTGCYQINGNMTRNTTLKGSDYAEKVKYWMPFIDNLYGIHDSSWRTVYGGEIYKSSGSHGCVNTPLDNVSVIYNNVQVGTPVVIY